MSAAYSEPPMKTRVTELLGSQAVGLIDDVPTCDPLIQRMVRECRERLAAGAAAFA